MNIVELLDQYGIEYQSEGRYCRPGWIQLRCPFCFGGSDPNKLYLGYNCSRNYAHCWRCGGHGIISTLVALGVPYPIAKANAKDLETDEQREIRQQRGKLKTPAGVEDMQKAHKQYLRNRGFDPAEIARLWGVQGIGIATRLQWRLFIPIYYRGRIVSWTTRGLTDKEPRYVSASPEEEAINHKELLYGSDLAGVCIAICEGPFDVWRVGPGAVAALGVQITDSQIRRIAEHPKRLIVFDNEPAAQRRARRLMDLLSVFPGETCNIVLESGNDPATADPAELDELRRMIE